jgi:hypothetical protein
MGFACASFARMSFHGSCKSFRDPRRCGRIADGPLGAREMGLNVSYLWSRGNEHRQECLCYQSVRVDGGWCRAARIGMPGFHNSANRSIGALGLCAAEWVRRTGRSTLVADQNSILPCGSSGALKVCVTSAVAQRTRTCASDCMPRRTCVSTCRIEKCVISRYVLLFRITQGGSKLRILRDVNIWSVRG